MCGRVRSQGHVFTQEIREVRYMVASMRVKRGSPAVPGEIVEPTVDATICQSLGREEMACDGLIDSRATVRPSIPEEPAGGFCLA